MSDKITKDDCFDIDSILREVDERRAKTCYVYEENNIDEEVSEQEIPEIKEIETQKEKIITSKEIFDWMESVISSVAVIVLAMTFIFRINEVYGISMQPSLYEGDRLIVMPLVSAPNYGDIVVVEAKYLPNSHTGELGEPIVKRVIGVGGDTIFIDAATGEVYRNGELLDEKYIAEMIDTSHVGNQNYPLTIKENEIFVMGDNRNHSTDSRYAKGYIYFVDCVKLEYVLGKAVFRIWPLDNIGGLYNNLTTKSQIAIIKE